MNRYFYIIISIVFLLMFFPIVSEGAIDISESFSSIQAKRQCLVLVDEDGSYTFTKIVESLEKFKPPIKDVPSYGYTDKIIWIWIRLNNKDIEEKNLLLEIQNPIMDEIGLYDPMQPGEGPHKLAGDMVPFDSRDIAYRNPVFRIKVKPGTSEYFLRIKTTSNSNVPMVLWSEESFNHHKEIESIILWIFYGLMLALMVYNLIIFTFVRERDYLYYVLFVLGFILFRLSYNGLAFQYLWTESLWWANACVPFLVAFLDFFLALFGYQFLRLREAPRFLKYIIYTLMGFFVFGMVFSIVGPYRPAIKMILGASILIVIVLFVGSIFALKWAKRQAIFYLIAWTMFLLGSFLNIFRDFGILPHNFFFVWSQQVGSAVQALLLSIGLADRINVMRSTIIESNEELVRVNNELVHEREQMAVTLRSIEEGVVTCNLTGTIRYMNRSMIDLLGVNAQAVVGQSITDVVHIADREDPEIEITHRLFSTSEIAETKEALLFISDSDKRIIEYTISPLMDQQSIRQGILLVIRDITERKRLEEEMVQKNKLDAMGTLAGGIAHDFNNILTGLTGNIGMALLSCQDNPEIVDLLEEAERISFKARNITQQFLTFARGGMPVRKKVCLENLIRETVNFTLSGSSVSAYYSITSDLWGVNIDEGQISQVINNIVLNAVQAMPGGGEIDIAAVNTVIKGRQSDYNKFVKVTIKDQGPGIPHGILPYIFDPFYTTKEKGNGLGLSSCYFIVEQHEGFIDVDTSPGKGAAFSVFLPSTGPLTPEHGNGIEKEGPVSGSERVLVMDDEDIIRRSTGKILQRLGYDVELANDGQQAIDIYIKSIDEENPFDVIILDLTIPGGMGGKDAVLELRKINKKVCVIASSGYSNDPVMSDFKKFGFNDILVKPYTVELLSQVLQRVLRKVK